LEFAKVVKPHFKSATAEERAGEYIYRPNEVTGEIRLVRSWHAIGQPVCDFI